MLSLIKIKGIHQCEDTDHVMLLSEQGRGRPTWSVRAGDLAPVVTMLVTPGLYYSLSDSVSDNLVS